MERISLLFKQNEDLYKPVMYEQSLIHAKSALMHIREAAQSRPASDMGLRKLRGGLMFGTFADLHMISEYYPALQAPMNLEEGTPIYEEPSL